MNKRKLLTLAMTLCMAAILAIGGTLAYFTDTDTKTNTFTFGNVDIAIEETFPEDELHPGEENALQKEVYVKNTGSEDAYMWIELWIPVPVDCPEDASKNSLHFNPFNTYKDKNGETVLCREAFANSNGYTLVAETVETDLGVKEIGEKKYHVYREHIKNDTPKAQGESTAALLSRVFMDKDIKQCTNADHTDCLILKDGTHYDGSWEIIVNAFGIQADAAITSIDEAIAAYNAN